MKTTILATILALSFMFLTTNSKADGVDTASAKANPSITTLNTICDFAFRLDPSQILKAAETVDLSDLSNSNKKESLRNNGDTASFAFKLDVKQIIDEAQQVDLSELNAK